MTGSPVRSLTGTIDTATPDDKLIFRSFGALAEFERGVIRERTIEELRAPRRRGRIGGRPSATSDNDIAMAKALLANPEIYVSTIARRFSVSPATLNRNISGGCGGQTPAS